MNKQQQRREFLKTSAVLGAGYFIAGQAAAARDLAPSEKLNVGVVGVAGRGGNNLSGVGKSENIVALCDVDSVRLGTAAKSFTGAQKYSDWRKMLEQKDIDAVVVSTPDHNHALVAVAAMKLGKHVYCEKPLAHSVHEARVMRDTAREMKVVTQMGNQLHATERLRQVVETIQAGVLGPVKEVVCWSDKVFSGGKRPSETPPVPATLDWDLWLGPAPVRPYHPTYVPFYWRGWWDFGVGNYGDMACHIMDAAYWGLGLQYPTKVWAEGPPVDADSAPAALVVHYEFPARGEQPAVKLSWYDGASAPPKKLYPQIENWPGQGSLIIGERGMLLFPHASGEVKFLPLNNAGDLKFAAPTLPRQQNDDHHQEWITACKTGGKALSNFDYGSALTESIMAGIVAYRVGQTLEWDGEKMTAANCPAAESLIRPTFRKGWSL